MWMTGYGGDGGELNLPESFNGRKLRPLIPRPASTSIPTTPTNAPCLSRIHGSDLLVLNHHLATVAEQSKREYNTQQPVVVSSRWNPTPEQLQTLEELYRRGTRTPSADQIQHITAQLRRYGKIEGKNVFYWFQNHKARERQKRRRQLESLVSDRETETAADRKESGANKTGFEVEQTKSWALPTNCSTALAEKTASIQRAAGVPECRTDGWVQFPEEELHQRRSLLERNATWQMMHFSSSPPTQSLINPTAGATTYTLTTTINPQTVRITPPKLLKGSQNLNKFLTHYGEDVNLVSSRQDGATEAVSESQTLQLFPLGRDEGNENITEETEELLNGAMDSNFTPYQFFEFLPLKN